MCVTMCHIRSLIHTIYMITQVRISLYFIILGCVIYNSLRIVYGPHDSHGSHDSHGPHDSHLSRYYCNSFVSWLIYMYIYMNYNDNNDMNETMT